MTTDSQARAVPRPRASFTASGGRAPERLPDQSLPDQSLPAQRAADPARSSGARATGARALDDAWERLGDGLFTYCLSVLCNQEEAVAAVREVRQLSVRHRRRLRRQDQLRAWLYALARHTCLQLVDAEPGRGRAPRPSGRHTAEHTRLALLAWPEAAGVTPAQREALELAGRHSLGAAELGAVLDLRTEQAGALLAQAVCELERTAAALAVLAAEACPELARLGAGRGAVLGTALRGELVRHVDACPTCRGTAERSAAAGPWPGTFRVPGELRLVRAPEEARKAADGEGFFAALAGGRRDEPKDLRFDRRGFPVHRTVRAERATMLRQRAVASSVIALVVAAPVVALWATHQGRNPPEDPVSSVRVDTAPSAFGTRSAAPDTSARPAVGAAQGHYGAALAAPSEPTASPARSLSSAPAAPASALLTVTAAEVAGRTVITLVNSGGTATAWQAGSDAGWLRLSRDSGTLGPGERVTLLVTVDQASLPRGPWRAQIAFEPADTVVVLQGPGTGPGSGSGQGSGQGSGSGGGRRGEPPPTASPSAPPTPTPAPTPVPSSGSGSGSGSGPGSGPGKPPPSASPTPTPTSTATADPAPSGTASTAPSADSPQRRRHAR